jgi:hypothetical protein
LELYHEISRFAIGKEKSRENFSRLLPLQDHHQIIIVQFFGFLLNDKPVRNAHVRERSKQPKTKD